MKHWQLCIQIGFAALWLACSPQPPAVVASGPLDAATDGADAVSGSLDGNHRVDAGQADGATDGEADAAQGRDCVGEFTFCDGFNGETLDLESWWYGRKVFGADNHGVIPENVSVHDGYVWFASNGDRYSGPLSGMRKAIGYIQDQPGDRTGGVIVSEAYFGPGRYEFRVALPDSTGVCSAMWTLHYQELYSDHPSHDDPLYDDLPVHGSGEDGWYKTPNHEIDIEIPTALAGQADSMASYRNARYNTWVGEARATDRLFDNGVAYNDGQFHTWRFDWHGGADSRVEFYIDDRHVYTSFTHIPEIHGRLWIGTWFPRWSGAVADFDVEYMKLDWVRYTAFDEPYRVIPETYPNDGMTKCQTKAENEANLPQCQLAR